MKLGVEVTGAGEVQVQAQARVGMEVEVKREIIGAEDGVSVAFQVQAKVNFGSKVGAEVEVEVEGELEVRIKVKVQVRPLRSMASSAEVEGEVMLSGQAGACVRALALGSEVRVPIPK